MGTSAKLHAINWGLKDVDSFRTKSEKLLTYRSLQVPSLTVLRKNITEKIRRTAWKRLCSSRAVAQTVVQTTLLKNMFLQNLDSSALDI